MIPSRTCASRQCRRYASRLRKTLRGWCREEQSTSLTALGHKLIRKCDYGEAKNILSQIPVSLRPREIQETIRDAEEKQEECDQLQEEVEAAIRKEYANELPALVKRFLQLKPGHKAMQKLADELKEFGAERAIKLRKCQRAGSADPPGSNQVDRRGRRRIWPLCSRSCILP